MSQLLLNIHLHLDTRPSTPFAFSPLRMALSFEFTVLCSKAKFRRKFKQRAVFRSHNLSFDYQLLFRRCHRRCCSTLLDACYKNGRSTLLVTARSSPSLQVILVTGFNMAMYAVANTGRHDMGHGLKAKATIPAGTRILVETPLFITNFTFLQRTPTGDREDELAARLTASLTKAQRDSFLGLANNKATFFDEERQEWIDSIFTGIIATNAVPVQLAPGREKYGKLGIFAKLSRANHGCRPNAQQTWNEDLQEVTLHALHNISPGEEITISYNQTVDPKWLEQIYGFQYVFTLFRFSLSHA
jgi:hypothetical protein